METPTGLFELLPNELVLYLATLMPIEDVVSLQDATHNLIPVLVERIDPSRYLQSIGPFTNIPELLEVMATHGAVLSGSRALEYFVPGSCTHKSDWDFYVPSVPCSVTAVKNALEQSGVMFESTLAWAARKLRQETTVVLSRSQIVSIAYEAFSSARSWSTEQRKVINSIHHLYPALTDMGLHIRKDGSVRWIDDIIPILIQECGSATFLEPREARTHGYPENVAAKVLSGIARRNGRTVSVQLVVGAIDSRMASVTEGLSRTVFGSIFTFYGSHVQCILTKHVAFHMYYRLAAEKRAYRWQIPEPIRERAEDAVEKYVSRGFRFTTASQNDEWTFRSAQDNDSFFIELDTHQYYSPPLSQVKELRWRHAGEVIKPSLQPKTIDSRNELLCFGIVSS
ncbi:hypothetical protein B0T10DRAFT_595985 [Thelonectria olida]|uniref:Uncharacterized protein n=1 Tax=Thelonectria olida TaxID=1576542 RepID=A0A9P8VN96_9HYPO|nr:hypothetical protein B0T10DRAFT_595985 [Thelonectria olida]